MTEMLYVVTADIMEREPDGLDPQDSSPVYRSHLTRRTWVYPSTAQIGEIMKAASEFGGINVAITEDSVTAAKMVQDRIATRRNVRLDD